MAQLPIFLKNTKGLMLLLVVVLTVGFFAGMEYKAYQVRKALNEATEELSEGITDIFDGGDEDANSASRQIEKSTVIQKIIGEDIQLATIKFKVSNSSEKQTLSGGFGSPAIAKEGAKFVVIDLSITNTTNAQFTFLPDDGFRLIDDKDRQFTTYGDTIGKVNNYLNVRKLSPGIVESGVLVYEIPQDSTSYSFAVGKGGTNEIYQVVLK